MNNNTLKPARQIPIRVAPTGILINNLNLLEHHRKRPVGVLRRAASPLNRALVVCAVAAGPDADADVHGRLGVVFPRERVGVVEGADGDVVDVPGCVRRGPGDCVVVAGGLGCGGGGPGGAVVGGCVAFACAG